MSNEKIKELTNTGSTDKNEEIKNLSDLNFKLPKLNFDFMQVSETYKALIKKSKFINDIVVRELKQKDAELEPAGGSHFDQSPMEIKVSISNYLTVKELYSAASVSKHWNSLTSLNLIWQKFLGKNSFDQFSTAKERYKSYNAFLGNSPTSVLLTNIAVNSPMHQNFQVERQIDGYIVGGDPSDNSKQFLIKK